jgi:copper chaperone NosL
LQKGEIAELQSYRATELQSHSKTARVRVYQWQKGKHEEGRETGKKMKSFAISFLLCLVIAAPAYAENPAKPTAKDKCPVCGMFVAKYPDWVAQITFKDGTVVFFDGAKDLFKYYFNLKKYNPDKTRTDIETIYVTEYYDMKSIEAHDAFFVIGSDVYGPMGRELIPFPTEADAREFMEDHGGERLLKFNDIKPAVIEKLDE